MEPTKNAFRFSQAAFRFSQAVVLAMLMAAYPNTSAYAGGKIFKTTDSHGNVTFTDVPLLLEPQKLRPQPKRDSQNPARPTQAQQSKRLRKKLCEPTSALVGQRCQ